MRNPDRQTMFHFKRFSVSNTRSAMKVGTDGVLLAAWAFDGLEASGAFKMLDVGCGTGVMSLILAQRFENAHVTGIDIDAEAAAEAAENFRESPWTDHMTAVHADFLNWAVSESPGGYDLIVCNPPFFTNGALAPDASRRCARHQDALTFASLFRGMSRILREGGRVAVVAPADAEGQLLFEAGLNGLSPLRLTRVKTVERKPCRRILLECGRSATVSGQPLIADLQLMTADGSPGEEYSRIVSPFYLKF